METLYGVAVNEAVRQTLNAQEGSGPGNGHHSTTITGDAPRSPLAALRLRLGHALLAAGRALTADATKPPEALLRP